MTTEAQTNAETVPTRPDDADWPLRPWVLGGMLAVAGLLVYLASSGSNAHTVPWRMALAALFVFGPLAAAFTLERGRYGQPAVFAGVVGLVMAGMAWRATSSADHYPDTQFWVGAGIVASLLALPLFQAGFHRRRFAIPYAEAHGHAWNDVLSGLGALVFLGLSWLVLTILNQLFQLVGINLLDWVMGKDWFSWTFSGAAFGAALGTLRNQLKVLGTLQSVVMLVLSLLAVPLALALLVFLIALIATGGQALWSATDSATPVLLACAIGAFGLGNAILRDSDADMTGNRVLRITALVLCLSILPLTMFAAISMGVRIGQYGLSPERLWGLVAVAVACAFGLAYLVAVIRGRKAGWRARVREANLHLAVAVSVVALILALPVFNFGAISARNQLARLESGAVTAEAFDYAALRWDFGDAGRKALATLTKNTNPKVAELAQTTLDQKERIYRSSAEQVNRTRADFNLDVQPDDPAVRDLVLDHLIANPYLCETRCVAIDLGKRGADGRDIALVSGSSYSRIVLPIGTDVTGQGRFRKAPELKANSTVEVRSIERRHIFIDGRPLEPPLDELEGASQPR